MSKRKDKGRQQFSGLDQHKRHKKLLTSPFARLGFSTISWMNDRLPEMIWLTLVRVVAGRESALLLTRLVAKFAEQRLRGGEPFDTSISSLGQLPDEQWGALVEHCKLDHPQLRRALRPLLAFSALPQHRRWLALIQQDPTQDDWSLLAAAVAETLDHQSEASTDARWARMLGYIATGHLYFQVTMADHVREILEYPNRGDLRSVGPSIRAGEISLGQTPTGASKPLQWPPKFWDTCLASTPCMSPAPTTPTLPRIGTDAFRVVNAWHAVGQHWRTTLASTAVDARHDAAFGFALYALSILRELLRPGIAASILGRSALRTLVELLVTFRYLLSRDDSSLWSAYRAFGAGQAKLAFLKLDKLDTAVGHVAEETLSTLANEDTWQEFVPINLGHWGGMDLRKMAEDAGAKTEYDKFYGWPSSFVHGQWGAVRDSVFSTCLNSLHRLHRVPREDTRQLEDVLADAADLTDQVLALLDKAYPSFGTRVSIAGETEPRSSAD